MGGIIFPVLGGSMTEPDSTRPLTSMTADDMGEEIAFLTRIWRVREDFVTGRAHVIAFPIDRKYRAVSKAGRTKIEAFMATLQDLRCVPLPTGLRRV
jgi:hypothetical protein